MRTRGYGNPNSYKDYTPTDQTVGRITTKRKVKALAKKFNKLCKTDKNFDRDKEFDNYWKKADEMGKEFLAEDDQASVANFNLATQWFRDNLD